MEQQNWEYPLAYAPIPKCIIKEEPVEEPNLEDIQQECGEHISEPLMAYPPLPHGGFKEELDSEDAGNDRSNSRVQVENGPVTYPSTLLGCIKEEPKFEEEEEEKGDECHLIAYPPLPHGDIKEESEVGDGRDECSSGVGLQQIRQQERNENLINEATEDGPIIVPFVDTPASGNMLLDSGDSLADKRKRNIKGHLPSGTIPSSSRILRSRSKGSGTLKNDDDGGVEQLEDEEFLMDKYEAEAKEHQNNSERYETSDHSSLDSVISSDEEDLITNHSLAGPAKRKKKSARIRPGEVSHSQQRDKLPFKCENCGRAFKVETYLKKHLARSCGTKPQFPCKDCGHQYTRKENLQKHLMKKHNVEKSQLATFGAGSKIRPVLPFKCDKCSRTYKQKCGLLQHLKYECEVDPSFACHLCHYRATRKGSLKHHLMTVHDVDRSQFTALGAAAPKTRPVQPFKCEKCGKSYKHKNVLTRHLKYECGVDPSFSCTQCNYRAAQKSHLKKHLINVHADAGLSQSEA